MVVEVELGERGYPVHIVDEGFAALPQALEDAGIGPRRVLVTEGTVGPLYADAVRDQLGDLPTIVLPAGEREKTLATWQRCVNALLEGGVDRRTTVLALGGGVLGDLAGFAAATTLRGLPFVQIPTTLLAMVDSSVGGKTGVNHPAGKNLVGAFHQPAAVFASLSTLDTLEPREIAAGLAEVVKTALVGDPDLLESLPDRWRQQLSAVVARCVRVKAGVVAADEREGGIRAVLNAGHTVAHGLETAAGHGSLRHGEAVAIGLVYESAWAVRAGICEDPQLPVRLERVLSALGCPVRVPDSLSRDAILQAMRVDKKAVQDKLTLPVPRRAGEMVLTKVPLAALDELLQDPR